MIILAVLLPWLSFILRGKIIQGIICLILQITLIGWLPAAIWAVASLLDGRNKARINKVKRQLN
ncbi:YqaE/Pmp3 family membrane protein [Empedobacter sedimenti]|uniref:YqaE/Pmp3 family membrane protein n=1 Tax=Empedobacter sedimenti TaxID=3042610 RepID=UPI0024A70993|nr:YqaE/Pmp3 family membrane protein [Empedobacter sedimenti]